jgi:hypothetical protein
VAALHPVRYTAVRCAALLIMKIIVLLFIVFILGSLFSALFFLLRDRSQSDRVVKALTVRVLLSVTLFALLMLGFYFGFITDKL